MNPKLLELIKEIEFNSPLRRHFFARYTYSFSPPELCLLCKCIEDTRHIEGAISEVGCAHGWTTVFLNKYMDAQNIQKDYYAIDTFSGFVPEDIEFEVANRGKTKGLFTGWKGNKKKWFDVAMRENKITRVCSIETDVNKFDLRTIGPLSFSLLDVDLYRPMKKALLELYEVLSPGGIIIVDDCDPSSLRCDGSDQAYREFMKERNQTERMIYGKLGVIRKPA